MGHVNNSFGSLVCPPLMFVCLVCFMVAVVYNGTVYNVMLVGLSLD